MDRDAWPMNDEPPKPAAPPQPQDQMQDQRGIVASATLLIFKPGLYAIGFRGAGDAADDAGPPLPCARLEPVATPGSPGRAFVSTVPEGGWLSRHTAAAHVLVVEGQAGAVLTLYRAGTAEAMPEVQFRALPGPGSGPGPAPPAAGATLLIHLEGQGDRTGAAGEWLGDLGGQSCIEGFCVTLPPGMAAAGLEYQGIMGADWRTPWFPAGTFCGSRGLRLPLLGFQLRLADAAPFECQASGHFAGLGIVGPGIVGPVGGGEDCAADRMPLTAMRLEIRARHG